MLWGKPLNDHQLGEMLIYTVFPPISDKVYYSYETEKSYIHWIKRFIAFHPMKPSREMGAAEVEAVLT
jgi:hypothetical protein